MIFKYGLRFVAFTWLNLCSMDSSLFFIVIVLVGRNFVFDICELKPKNLKEPENRINLKHIFSFRNLGFYSHGI